MKSLLQTIAKELVDYPDKVTVSQKEEEDKIILELKVAPEDMGKIIGKQGRIAKSIRTIIKAASLDVTKKVVVDIVE
ncbi:RNA-binding protein [Sporanaerobium hydrogeniformans]|uniref:RNA-binding protein n=1 Tax=Sporanaerobium hydrogeniformans TaxID=3072179 RepID=A0AC61DDH9_9FIRM|nr:KH domain-containing protein [Sporanaerobium hydrogeniformans]PHV71118.1 RNA-binding protein [Sporanaerobium hydrogeniformans]